MNAADLRRNLARQERARRSTYEAARWRDVRTRPTRLALELSALCDRVLDTPGAHVLASAPPRHGKTEAIGRAMPLSGALRAQAADKEWRVLYVTSTDTRARDVCRDARRDAERIHAETGDPWWAPSDVWSATQWATKGGYSWVALGREAASGGVGADLLVLDDLIGSAATYRSAATMAAIRRAVQEDHLSRLLDGGRVVHLETRRGVEDTTAWLAEEYGWEHHVWRCLDPERGYLWPEVYGEAWRATMPHLTDASPVWRALYQQEPIPEGGTLIAPEWLDAEYSELPTLAARLAERRIMGVDLAATGRGDPAAIVVLGCRGAYRDVLWAGLQRVPYPEQRRWLVEAAKEWDVHGVHVERAAGGDAMVADLASVVAGIQGHPPTGSKAVRAAPYLPLMAARQLRLPAAVQPWMRGYREAMVSVTGMGDEDDHYLDATVWALVGAQADRRPTHRQWAQALGSG